MSLFKWNFLLGYILQNSIINIFYKSALCFAVETENISIIKLLIDSYIDFDGYVIKFNFFNKI